MLLGRLQKLSKGDAIARTEALLERFGSRTPPTARSVPTPAACAGDSTSPPAWSCTGRSSSSTSRPPASIPRAGPRCGGRSRASSQDGAALLLTTQYLEEADRLADEIVVLSGGKTVAAGTPAQLKARVGDRRVHVSIPADGALATAARVFERLEPELDVRARKLTIPAPDGPRDLKPRSTRSIRPAWSSKRRR